MLTKIKIKRITIPNFLVLIENQMSGRIIEIEDPSVGDVKLDAFIFEDNGQKSIWMMGDDDY